MEKDETSQPQDMQDDNALRQLVTPDQEELLNLIDKFREYRLNEIVDLPEIVVCGNQSCGKSSVLEAISQLTFPRGQTLCTTFATELVLRRGTPRATVRIRPASSGEPIKDFQPSSGTVENVGSMINEAKDHLLEHHLESCKESFFEETLQIEVCNPNWPPLTLVDLPGLIQSANPNQTQHDVDLVHRMVQKYMQSSKTIILAVVSANDDPANQKILQMAKEIDPSGERTMGIITKPDKADPGSARELQFVEYAQNKHEQYRFQLGWHVVRNRGFNEEGSGLEELEQKQFGPDSIWKQHLPSEQLGINALRDKLSHVLENHIRESLPAVIRTIKNELHACQERLKLIGEPRSTTIEQQAYLVPISVKFERLVRQAVSGDVIKSKLFTKPETHKDQRNLRSFVECNNLHFADLMYERGHRWAIKSSEEYPEWPVVRGDSKYNFGDTAVPGEISAQEYLRRIQNLLEENRGRHLRTLFEPRLMTCIFRDQSERWMIIAEAHIDNIFGAVACLLKDISKAVANEYTAKAIQEHLISDFLKKKRHELKLKLTEVLRPYRDLYPATYTRDFVADVQVRQGQRNHTVAVNGLVHDLGAWKPKFSADSDAYKLTEHTLSILSKVPSTTPEFASTPTAILDLTYLYYKASLSKKLLRSSSNITADCLEDLHRQCGRISHRELSDIRSRQDILSGRSVHDGEKRSETPVCPCFGAHSHLPRAHETHGERRKADERPRNLLGQAGRLAHVFLDRRWTT
jgi:GTP-binding protein EngB required for normal cell division